LLIWRPEWRRTAFLVLILLSIATELLAWLRGSRGRLGWYLAALASLAVAFVIWNLDNLGIWCQPESLLQGHAFWHVLGAAAGLGIYRYYASLEDKR
jgi:hypothetical protein